MFLKNYISFAVLSCVFAYFLLTIVNEIKTVVKIHQKLSGRSPMLLVEIRLRHATPTPTPTALVTTSTSPTSNKTTLTTTPIAPVSTRPETKEMIVSHIASETRENYTGTSDPYTSNKAQENMTQPPTQLPPAATVPKITGTASTTQSSSRTNANKSGFYVPGRRDRSGAAIFAMLSAHSFAYKNNFTFLGTCFEGIAKHGGTGEYVPSRIALHKKLVASIGLENELLFACPPSNLTQQEKIPQEHQQQQDVFLSLPNAGGSPKTTMTPAWLDHIRSISRSKIESAEAASEDKTLTASMGLQVAVHVRRGDAHPCMSNVHYIASSYYQDALHFYIPKLVQQRQQVASTPPRVHVTIYSESFTFEPWDDSWKQKWGNQTNPEIHVTTELELDTDEDELWKRFVSADLVILSKSTFLTLPSLLNSNGMIVTPPFREMVYFTEKTKYTHWHMVDTSILNKADEQMIILQQQNNCSSPDIAEKIGQDWAHAFFGRHKQKNNTSTL